MGFYPNVERWRARIERLVTDTGIPVDYVLAYMQKESGGNPCSTGFIEKGPDGQMFNREAGLGQIYFTSPTDIEHGVTIPQLRGMCIGTTSKASRPATEAEKEANCASLVRQISAHRAVARLQLQLVHAEWPEDSQDFWALVKLQHGLPLVSKKLLPQFDKVHDRPPESWNEWWTWIEGLSKEELGSTLARWYGDSLKRIRANAEKVAAMSGGATISGSLLGALLVPVLLLVAVKFGVPFVA